MDWKCHNKAKKPFWISLNQHKKDKQLEGGY